MVKYIVKKGSVVLPKEGDSSARVVREGGSVELSEEHGDKLVKAGILEPAPGRAKADVKTEDEKPAATRGRAPKVDNNV